MQTPQCKLCKASLSRVYLTKHWTKHAMTTVPILMCPVCKEIEVTHKMLKEWFGKTYLKRKAGRDD